jgi:SP family general alpha glucoside:H+ symporter-like MFS transporter
VGVGRVVGIPNWSENDAERLFAIRYSRGTIIGALAMMTAFIFIPFFAPNKPVLLVGNLLQGLSWGVFQTITTAYGAEVCPVPLRHYLTTYVNLCWVLGQLIAAGVLKAFLQRTDQWGYKIPYALQWVWPLPIAIGCYLAPESPWWLVRKEKHEQAERSLKRLARASGFSQRDCDRQMAMMIHTNEMEKQVSAGTTYWDCFKGTERRRTEIVCCVWMIQTLCGAPLMGLSSYFYTNAGMSTSNAFTFSIGQYALGAAGTIASWFVMTKVGRRALYLWGCVALFVILVIIGGMGIPSKPSTALSWTAGSFMLLFTGIYDLTIGPVCYCICAEIPSTRLRPKSIVLARNAYNVVGIAFANIVTPRMLNTAEWNWGAKSGFFWAGCNALCCVWIWFRLPETKGLTYGQMDILFENKISARKFATTEVDQYGDLDALKQEGYIHAAPGAIH